MAKRCMTCGEMKPAKDFYLVKPRRGRKAHLYPHCKGCAIDIQRVRQLRGKYGMTIEEYQRKVEEQGNLCAICRLSETVVRDGRIVMLGVDHDHDTGLNRGLLCRGCNIGIGNLKDDPALLRAAADYLEFYATLHQVGAAAPEGT